MGATLASLTGAILAPAVPSVIDTTTLQFIGIPASPGLRAAVDVWLRGIAGILAVVPAMLVFGSNR